MHFLEGSFTTKEDPPIVFYEACETAYPDLRIEAMFYEYVGNFTGIWTTDQGLESYNFNRDHFDDVPKELIQCFGLSNPEMSETEDEETEDEETEDEETED